MHRTAAAVATAAAIVLTQLASTVPSTAADEDDALPTTTFIAIPEDPAEFLASGAKTPTCNTAAIAPADVDATDPLHVVGRTHVECGDLSYPGSLVAKLYYSTDPTKIGSQIGNSYSTSGSTPFQVDAKIDRLTAPEGWYRTIGTSTITYNFKLDTHRKYNGCTYLSSYTIRCTATSSPVLIHSMEPGSPLRTVMDFLTRVGR